MHSTELKSVAFAAAFGCCVLSDVANASTPFSLPIQRRHVSPVHASKRDLPGPVSVKNDLGWLTYTVNISIGTPPQTSEVILDTGSSDLWVLGPKAFPPDAGGPPMYLGTSIDPSKSSSGKVLEQGTFVIKYGSSSSSVQGDFYEDTVTLGDLTVKDQTYAVATVAGGVQGGIVGLGYSSSEYGKTYSNLLDSLMHQNIIPAAAYSLWLDGNKASSGQVLFGGYDSEKHTGDLIVMRTQPDPSTGSVDRLLVPWTNLSITNGDSTTLFTDPSSFGLAALLDSGSSYTQLPAVLVKEIANYLGVDLSNGPQVPCDTGVAPITIDFGFGGPRGGVIQVPLEEFIVPIAERYGSRLTRSNGEPGCELVLQTSPTGGFPILGDTFLRSAYVVYDLANNRIGMAQTNFASNGSNVQPIPSGGIAAIPSAIVATELYLPPSATSVATYSTTLPRPSDYRTEFEGVTQLVGPIPSTVIGAFPKHSIYSSTALPIGDGDPYLMTDGKSSRTARPTASAPTLRTSSGAAAPFSAPPLFNFSITHTLMLVIMVVIMYCSGMFVILI